MFLLYIKLKIWQEVFRLFPFLKKEKKKGRGAFLKSEKQDGNIIWLKGKNKWTSRIVEY